MGIRDETENSSCSWIYMIGLKYAELFVEAVIECVRRDGRIM